MEYYNILTDFSSRNVYPYDSYDYLRLVIPAPYPLLHTGSIPPFSLVVAGPLSCYATRQILKYNIMYLSRETPAYSGYSCAGQDLSKFYSQVFFFFLPVLPVSGVAWFPVVTPPPLPDFLPWIGQLIVTLACFSRTWIPESSFLRPPRTVTMYSMIRLVPVYLPIYVPVSAT